MLQKTSFDQGLCSFAVLEDRTEGVPAFYHTFHCHQGTVSEALRDEIPHWSRENPVLIDGRTGIGKSTFVKTDLLADAQQKGKNVLILSNRIAQSSQQKADIIPATSSPLEGQLTDEGLRKQEDFGDVIVLTYHRLPTFLKDYRYEKWRDNLLYVVLDEAHFFVADSLFNERCDYYLELITRYFWHAIRIYMTATSWDVLWPLAEAEQNNYPGFLPQYSWKPEREFIRYIFQANYSNYSLKFVENYEELFPLINEDPATKWLLFVDSKEQGKSIQKELGSRAAYVDTDSKGTATWSTLVHTSRFNEQVLIATAVIDCGVNICDPEVKNIVLTTDDRTRFIQELGRKRHIPGEQITVWVVKPSKKKVAARLSDCRDSLLWLDRYDDTQGRWDANRLLAQELWNCGDPKFSTLFRLANGRLRRNELAYFYLKRRYKFLLQLSEGADFKDIVYQWLGIQNTENEDLVKINAFYDEYGNAGLSEALKTELRALIVSAYCNAGHTEPQPKRIETHGAGALNNRLNTLGFAYRITEKDSVWVLEKVEGGVRDG